jgi:hypothetical protein
MVPEANRILLKKILNYFFFFGLSTQLFNHHSSRRVSMMLRAIFLPIFVFSRFKTWGSQSFGG